MSGKSPAERVVIERLAFPGGGAIEFGALAAPVTAFFLLGFINSINLVDGLDGLAIDLDFEVAVLGCPFSGMVGFPDRRMVRYFSQGIHIYGYRSPG